ncbi:MAG: site-specific recombinase [Actinomycetota bacterium]|jgi:DNA invertase Pin-like site-specific DNA recombinase|nr:site-specific recombinase [Actinomycetota bacterium]
MDKVKPLRAAIYARISRDREGAGLGVERQEADCRALAKRLGWEVVELFVDNDISAYSGKPRPQYRAMLEAIAAGQIEGVLAWHTDRLHRRATELEQFVVIAEAHHLQVQTVTAGNVDLSSPSGRMVARMLGAAAQHEVDHARERMQRAKDQMLIDGKVRGGARPFGYEPGGMIIRESEAIHIREATAAVLAGRSLAGIARSLNERGILSSRGAQWNFGTVRDMLLRPRNAALSARGLPGRKTMHSALTSERFEVEIVGPALWPAVVPEDEWRALVSTLLDGSRRTQNGNDARWLGSGLYICGVCGGRLRPAPYGGTGNGGRARTHLYRCVESAHLTVNCAPTDAYVLEVVAERVRDPRIIAQMHRKDPELEVAKRQRAKLSADLARFELDYINGDIDAALRNRARLKTETEMNAVDEVITRALRFSKSAEVIRASDPGQAFLDADIDVQRSVLASVLRVTVITAKEAGQPIGGKWSPQRLILSDPDAAEVDAA